MLRRGAGNEELLAFLKAIIHEKSRYTRLNSPGGQFEQFSMQSIGG